LDYWITELLDDSMDRESVRSMERLCWREVGKAGGKTGLRWRSFRACLGQVAQFRGPWCWPDRRRDMNFKSPEKYTCKFNGRIYPIRPFQKVRVLTQPKGLCAKTDA
jgi:hypothetical protein